MEEITNNDFALVALAQEGNEDAINLLYEKYKPIIVKKSAMAIGYASHHGIEVNDIMQEGFMALDEAIKNFNQDNDATFYTFALLCIDRKIVNYLKKITGARDKVLNDAVTIDENLERILKDSTNVEKILLGKDKNIEIIDEIKKILTPFEWSVFEMRLKNYSFEEISKVLNKDLKSVYNTFQRIRNKIKKNIKIDD